MVILVKCVYLKLGSGPKCCPLTHAFSSPTCPLVRTGVDITTLPWRTHAQLCFLKSTTGAMSVRKGK
uniref:Uncharacterized protein n=1 Tax=Anguilla anguilla TaxID=7936 RepID=A0A0E9P9N9_ANGAN